MNTRSYSYGKALTYSNANTTRMLTVYKKIQGQMKVKASVDSRGVNMAAITRGMVYVELAEWLKVGVVEHWYGRSVGGEVDSRHLEETVEG